MENINEAELNNNDMDLETAFTELEELTGKMQSGDLSLEETFNLYKRGIELVNLCNNKIQKVECDIKVITDDMAE